MAAHRDTRFDSDLVGLFQSDDSYQSFETHLSRVKGARRLRLLVIDGVKKHRETIVSFTQYLKKECTPIGEYVNTLTPAQSAEFFAPQGILDNTYSAVCVMLASEQRKVAAKADLIAAQLEVSRLMALVEQLEKK